MTNGEVYELYQALDRISKDKDLKFKVKTGYAIAKNKETLRTEASLIYNMRRDIIMEYGQLDENGSGDIIIPRDKIDEVNQKINDLMSIESNLSIIKLSADAFDDNELNIEDLEGLMPMLDI